MEILVQDCDEDGGLLTENHLASAGHRVKIIKNTDELKEAARNYNPDMVIVNAGKGHDYNFLPQFKNYLLQYAERHIPVGIISGHAETHKVEICKQLGADFYLCKPCFREDLVNTVNRAFEEIERARPLHPELYRTMVQRKNNRDYASTRS
jgi:DNA-binding response OmpR family regulator